MRKILLLTYSIFLLTSSILHSQPKLVVGIVVDQMRYDYINKYWNKFGEGGFKRLVNDGYNCKNTFYNYTPTYTGPGHASIFTGTTPSQNGIVANTWYNSAENSFVYCSQDKNVKNLGGSETAKTMSPKNLLANTIGDELKQTSPRSKVIGIALKDRGAILPAGKNANAAYWYEGKTGNWISSTFYMTELPKWVSNFNALQLARKSLQNSWKTLLPIEQYTESIADDNEFEEPFKSELRPVFPHKIDQLLTDNDSLELIRTTPFGNSLTSYFAYAAIKGENLGKNGNTDIITISFSSTDYIGHRFGPTSVEVEDTYLRMDMEIASTLDFLDKWMGKNEYLLFLTSDHGAGDNVAYLKSKNIKAGFFNEKKIANKLKKALMEKFDDTLVTQVENQQVYLDLNKLNTLKINKEDVYIFIKEQLMEMDGVRYVLSDDDLKSHKKTMEQEELIANGYMENRSGNLFIVFGPNWLDSESKKGTTHGSGYEYDTHVPLLWYGWHIPKGSSEEKISITDIAPTVLKLLQIKQPETLKGKSIKEIIK